MKSWAEYGERTRSLREKEWYDLSPQKRHELLEMLDDILGKGWQSRLKD